MRTSHAIFTIPDDFFVFGDKEKSGQACYLKVRLPCLPHTEYFDYVHNANKPENTSIKTKVSMETKKNTTIAEADNKVYVHASVNDVKCGRGDRNYQHPGNKYLRTLIAPKVASYQKCTIKAQKSAIIETVIEGVFRRGGRFLKYDHAAIKWYDGGLKAAKLRVSIAFRDGVKRRREGRDKPPNVEIRCAKRKKEECTYSEKHALEALEALYNANNVKVHFIKIEGNASARANDEQQLPKPKPQGESDYGQKLDGNNLSKIRPQGEENQRPRIDDMQQLQKIVPQNEQNYEQKLEKTSKIISEDRESHQLDKDRAPKPISEDEECHEEKLDDGPVIETISGDDECQQLLKQNRKEEVSWLEFRVSDAFREAVARRKRNTSFRKLTL